MDIGIIGLGKMGHGVASRLLEAGHRVVAFNRSFDKTSELAEHGAVATKSLQELVTALPAPRTVWTYLPAGDITQEHQEELLELLEAGDTLLDGGNSNFHLSIAMAERCKAKGIHWGDVGTSGGISGAKEGYCLMIGTDNETFTRLMPLWEAVAQKEAFARVGESGGGHYVKMVHNAIEYGMLQAFGEGMNLLEQGSFAGQIDLSAATGVWTHGSIIRSRIGDLVHEAYQKPELLKDARTAIDDNGMARWTVDEAIATATPLPSITASLFARFTSRQENHPGNKLISAVRHLFGGHPL